MNRIHRPLPTAVKLALATLAIVTALAACDDPLTHNPTMPNPAVLLSTETVGGDSIPDDRLACVPRSFITARQVTPGTAEDANGNGVVCDELLDGPEAPAARTLDDVLLPAIILSDSTQAP